MGNCSKLSPLQFYDPLLSLDCLREEFVCREGFQASPSFHLNIAKADLQVRLVPKTFSFEVPNFPDPRLRVGPNGEIRSSIRVRDNEIPLMFRSLLTFHDIHLDGPWDLSISPDRVLVGEYGGLHFIFGTDVDWFERIADPARYPDIDDLHELLGLSPPPEICAPLGWEEPARPEFCELESQLPHDYSKAWFPMDFGSPDDPRLDLTLTPWLPAWLAQDNGRLPERMSWLELAHRFLSRPDETKDQDLEKVLTKIVFSDGSHPHRLADLLDQGEVLATIEDFSLKLDPMELGGVRLLEGEIRSGLGGMAVQSDLQKSTIDIQAKLNVQLSLEIPRLGNIKLESPVEFRTQLKRNGQRIDWIPGSTVLEFSHLRVFFEEMDFSFTSRLDLQDSDGEFKFHLQGEWEGKEKSSLELEGEIPITIKDGSYIWEDCLDDLEIFARLKYRRGLGPAYSADLYLNSFVPAPFVSAPSAKDLGLRVHLDLAKEGTPILSGGAFQVQRIEAGGAEGQRKWLYLLRGEAQEIRWDDLVLGNPSLRAELEQIPNGKTETHFLIPQFTFSANPQVSTGWLRGPLEIAHEGRKDPLRLIWSPKTKEIQVINLNLEMSAQGIALPRALRSRQAKWRKRRRETGRSLPRAVTALGVDGRLQGAFRFRLNPFSGKGELRLVGDPQGDVYFLDSRGRVLAPPLLRETRWSFRRVDRVLMQQGFAVGIFRLVTRLNAEGLRAFGYGLPLDARIVMSHRDVMLKPGGIPAANRVYYRKLFREMAKKSGLDLLLKPEGGGR